VYARGGRYWNAKISHIQYDFYFKIVAWFGEVDMTLLQQKPLEEMKQAIIPQMNVMCVPTINKAGDISDMIV
jgi:hypothetical protein